MIHGTMRYDGHSMITHHGRPAIVAADMGIQANKMTGTMPNNSILNY